MSSTKVFNEQATILARTKYGWAEDFYLDYYELSTKEIKYDI